jgi:hypothetical protein
MTTKNGARHSSSLEDSNQNTRLTSDLGYQALELYSGGLSLLCDKTEYTGTERILLEFKGSAKLIAYCNLSDASSAHISNSSNLWLCVKEQGQVSAAHIHSSEDFNSVSHNVKAVLRLNSRGIRVYPNKRKKLFS